MFLIDTSVWINVLRDQKYLQRTDRPQERKALRPHPIALQELIRQQKIKNTY